jgi:hypothetical protein
VFFRSTVTDTSAVPPFFTGLPEVVALKPEYPNDV